MKSIEAGLVALIALSVPARGVVAEESPGARANVVGTVQDAYGDPVAGATVEVLDQTGNQIGSSQTTSAGGYRIACVRSGDYRLRLRPGSASYQGQTVTVPVDQRGLRVSWKVARDKAALAQATPTGGACAAGDAAAAPAAATGGMTDGTAAAVGGGSLAVIGGTIGGLDASGAFDANKSDSDLQ